LAISLSVGIISQTHVSVKKNVISSVIHRETKRQRLIFTCRCRVEGAM